MAYTKVYYDDIWEVTDKGSKKCQEWKGNFESLSKTFETFIESDSFKGQAATNMKNYLEQVHGILVASIFTVLQSYYILAIDYYGGYTRNVDTGDGNEHGLRYTTIVNGEVSETGSIQSKLNDVIKTAEEVVSAANGVKGSISDLVTIVAKPRTDELYNQINNAKSKAQTVHDNVISHEASRVNDFIEIESIISQALSIINSQLGQNRVQIVAYQQGDIGKMCDIENLVVNLNAVSDKVKPISENEHFEEDANLVLNRDAYIQAEEEASREWARWAAIGVAVIGAIAVTVVTAGAAGPGACALVGATAAAVGTGASLLAEEYVVKGNLDEMDWSDFGKKVVVAAAGGAVTGYLGAISQGSAIRQPIKNATIAFGNVVKQEVAEGLAGATWEVGEAIGEAIVGEKPGKEILSTLGNDVLGEIKTTAKDITTKGAKEFVGGMIAGNFNVNTSDKSALRKMGENTLEKATGELAEGMVDTAWGVGEAVLDSDSSTTVESALKKGLKDTVSDVAKSVVETSVSEGAFAPVTKIDNKTGKVIAETIKDTTADTVGKVTDGVVERTFDYAYGDEKDSSRIFGDIWEKDLEGGQAIVESAGESASKHITNEIYKDDEYYNELKKIDTDGDGKIEVVQFDDYAVTKQDYDAAVKNAGKGAFKDKTVQDILGLDKDTNLDSRKERVVSIDMTEEYSPSRKTTDTVTVDGKYTFRKEYYESSLNVAGTEEYGNKTAQEILGIPKDTDLSEDKITYKNRVDNDKIGADEEIKLHNDYGTNATKIHISSMKRETREAREKAKENLNNK